MEIEIGKTYNDIYLNGRKSRKTNILVQKDLGMRIIRGVYYYLYECIDLQTGQTEVFYKQVDESGDYVDYTRSCPDDSFEVNILFDEYDDFLKNQRTLVNKKVKSLEKIHKNRLNKIKEQINIQKDKSLLIGLKLHLIQKESPSMAGYTAYKNWSINNQKQFELLKTLIYG